MLQALCMAIELLVKLNCKENILNEHTHQVTPFPSSSICERITPRLAHANAAVVLSAVKCLMKFMELMVSDSEFVKNLTKKLAPPLVTLLSSEPEVSATTRETS